MLPTGIELALRSASVCDYQWTRVGQDAYTFALVGTSSLAPDAVRRVNEGFHDKAVSIEPDYEVGDHIQVIAGVTVWGDAVDLELLNGELVRAPTPADPKTGSLGWKLSKSDQTRLFGGRQTATP